jgi:hypothetical protein
VLLTIAMVVRGAGFGSTMMPTMAAAYATLDRKDIAHATPQLNVLQRVGGSVGTALLATILQSQLTDATGSSARIGEGGAQNAGNVSAATLDAVGGAFGNTFVWVLACTAIALIPAALLRRAERRARAERATQHDQTLADEAQVAAAELEHA